jgi:diguanylate cyclase (GGDEF)-like protein
MREPAEEREESPRAAKILVVDDEEIMREFLGDVLRDEGYEATAVRSGEEGLAKAREIHYDIILTDIKMPGIGGLRFLEQVKGLDPVAEVLVMTGYGSVDSAVEAMKLGAADYLTKPLNIDQIRIVVKRTLERKRLARDAEQTEFYKALSQSDGLTGLYNHRTFHELLASELARSRRYLRPLSLMMIDIDDFKQFNDRNGHPTGDIALRKVGWLFREKTRRCDFVCRYGGEEFAIIVPETDLEGARTVAQRLRAAIDESPFDTEANMPPGRLTVSIGVASFPSEAQTKEELVERADRALYEAKQRGKNRTYTWKETKETDEGRAAGP